VGLQTGQQKPGLLVRVGEKADRQSLLLALQVKKKAANFSMYQQYHILLHFRESRIHRAEAPRLCIDAIRAPRANLHSFVLTWTFEEHQWEVLYSHFIRGRRRLLQTFPTAQVWRANGTDPTVQTSSSRGTMFALQNRCCLRVPDTIQSLRPIVPLQLVSQHGIHLCAFSSSTKPANICQTIT